MTPLLLLDIGGISAMARVVADASVIVKLFVNEVYTNKALELINDYASETIAIAVPSLLVYEVLNGVRFNTSKKFSSEELKKVAETIQEYNFTVMQPSQNLLEEAIKMSHKYSLTIYDAIYVALASIQNAVLYTADMNIIKNVKLPFVKHIKDFVSR
jgi:predicted nucleic acid-binding protein